MNTHKLRILCLWFSRVSVYCSVCTIILVVLWHVFGTLMQLLEQSLLVTILLEICLLTRCFPFSGYPLTDWSRVLSLWTFSTRKRWLLVIAVIALLAYCIISSCKNDLWLYMIWEAVEREAKRSLVDSAKNFRLWLIHPRKECSIIAWNWEIEAFSYPCISKIAILLQDLSSQ